jgi:hypothetical protein
MNGSRSGALLSGLSSIGRRTARTARSSGRSPRIIPSRSFKISSRSSFVRSPKGGWPCRPGRLRHPRSPYGRRDHHFAASSLLISNIVRNPRQSERVAPFAYKRTIVPEANDRFTLQIASEVSTYQQFRIRLTTVDGRQIISPLCRMHFLVPRKFSRKEGYVIEDRQQPV